MKTYQELYPDIVVGDLYQDPAQRPRKGVEYLPTLTTGCARLYAYKNKRFLSGVELLQLHSIPVTEIVSRTMRSRRIAVHHLSHRAQCKLAGNCMHTACVGLMLCAVLLFTVQLP